MYYFHPSAIRERRALASPKALALHNSFQIQNSGEEIGATPPVANALPFGSLPLKNPPQTRTISDQFESKKRANSKRGQANFDDDIRRAPPHWNTHLPETESIRLDPTPNEQLSPKSPVQELSVLRDVIEICKILRLLWIRGTVFVIHEHGGPVAVAFGYAWFVSQMAFEFDSPYPLLLHPITWVLLGLARGLSFTGCYLVCLALGLVFALLGTLGVRMWIGAFGPPIGNLLSLLQDKSPGNVLFAMVTLAAAVTLYVEYLGLNCGEGSQSQNAGFLQSEFCR